MPRHKTSPGSQGTRAFSLSESRIVADLGIARINPTSCHPLRPPHLLHPLHPLHALPYRRRPIRVICVIWLIRDSDSDPRRLILFIL